MTRLKRLIHKSSDQDREVTWAFANIAQNLIYSGGPLVRHFEHMQLVPGGRRFKPREASFELIQLSVLARGYDGRALQHKPEDQRRYPGSVANPRPLDRRGR
jgi:hypothetical protein